MRKSPRNNVPAPLPRHLLAEAAIRGLGLLLDYDGTLAELVTDPARAVPLPGAAELIDRIARHRDRARVAIVTGRRIENLKRLLKVNPEVVLSGVHGLQICSAEGTITFDPEASECAEELERVRDWLQREIPRGCGFRIEDKQFSIGLHSREADADEAQRVDTNFIKFVERETPHLRTLQLKMLIEAMPKIAGKNHAVARIKRMLPQPFVTAYFGDDATDESAFSALDANDVGVLVGAPRQTRARFFVEGPREVVAQLEIIAESLESLSGASRRL
jgi:trehalose 6-phosphate synthase/phosphatase